MSQDSESTAGDETGVREEARDRNEDQEIPVPNRKPAERPEPTRFGDWEKDGRCIDF